MAFASTMVWEVRTTGSAANGGGFDPTSGTPGTDYSQQDSAQAAYTDLVIDGAINTNCTSAANPFGAAHVGNIINVTGGTGFTVQRVQIMSVAASVATCDKSLGTLGSTGGTGNLGGALDSPATAVPLMVGSNTLWIQSGTYNITVTLTPPAGAAGSPTRISGYNTARGDLNSVASFANHPVITANNAAIVGITGSANYLWISTLSFNGGVGATKGTRGVLLNGQESVLMDCYASGMSTTGFTDSGSLNVVLRCTVSVPNASTSGITATGGRSLLVACVSLGSAVYGMRITGNGSRIIGCIASGTTGSPGHGFSLEANGDAIGNVAYGNAGSGINFSTAIEIGLICNNVLTSNGGYGLTSASTSWTMFPVDYNAFYANTSGARNNMPAGAHDVTLTADPFVNAAGNDFRLNTTAGGGAACRNAGFPGEMPGLAGVLGYADIGVYRHQDDVINTNFEQLGMVGRVYR